MAGTPSSPGRPPRRTASSDADRSAFDAACAEAGVRAEHRTPLWAVYAAMPGRSAAPDRLAWILADYGHWLLFEASRAGDATAARRFEQHWRLYIGGFLGRQLPADAVDEIIGTFFIRAYERVAERFCWQCPFTAYLRSIVINLWRDEGQRMAAMQRRETSLDDAAAPGGPWLESLEPAPDASLASSEIVETMRAALMDLEPADRQVLLACLVRGESGQALAAEMGLSRDALYQRLHRAKRRLRARYEARERAGRP